jgi:diguanylate cyclase (GGDEF)-like protein
VRARAEEVQEDSRTTATPWLAFLRPVRTGAEFLAEKLRADVEASPVRHDGATVEVTISVGVATIDVPRRYSPEVEAELIRRADEAMYQAKSGGRNRVVVAPIRQSDPE